MSVAGLSGLFRVSDVGRYSVSRVGRGKFRPFTRPKVNVFPGMVDSQRTRSRLWMMMGILCSLVLGVAAILTVWLWLMLSVMRKVEND